MVDLDIDALIDNAEKETTGTIISQQHLRGEWQEPRPWSRLDSFLAIITFIVVIVVIYSIAKVVGQGSVQFDQPELHGLIAKR